MKRNRFIIIGSLLMILLIGIVVFLDLAGAFSYSDLPFAIAFAVYFLFMFIQRASSKMSFIFTLYFLITMALSYIKTGSGAITERLGEWFYLFFLVGIIHYAKEAWSMKL